MAKVSILNLKAKSVGELELSDTVFGAEVNEGLIYDVVRAQLAGQRSGTAKTKGRSEVAGAYHKIYRQKGTGNARMGSKRSPVHVGGGKAHGPQPRSYAFRPPRKMRLGAMISALSHKLKEGKLTVVDDFQLSEVKTKGLETVLRTLKVDSGSLIIDAVDNANLRLSVRNMPGNQFLPPEGINVYDVLRHDHLVMTKQAVAAVESRLQKA